MKKPFFAKFLENQISQRQTAGVKGGDEWPMTTDKYPSDNEDGGDITYTLHDIDDYLTKKFPSDAEER